MKGNNSFFDSYNGANSRDVGIVQSENITEIDKEHKKVPTKGVPNSVTIIKRNGKTETERYYDSNGDPYLDIDYTDHGNSRTHPTVPHQHKWEKGEDGKIRRKGWTEIQK